MTRTFPELVSAIIEVDDDIDLDPFITAASVLVDKIDETDADDAISDDVLEIIETWLAAHFYAIRDPRTTQEKAGPVSANFESKVDLGLNLTRYGQQAMMLDTSGVLRAINSGKSLAAQVPSVLWLGKKCC